MQSIRDNFQTNALAYLTQNPFAADVELPASYEEAIKGKYSKQWTAAIRDEIYSLIKLNVFKVVKRNKIPKNANIINGKWVFNIKPNALGHIDSFKCRFCARGFLQKYGMGY